MYYPDIYSTYSSLNQTSTVPPPPPPATSTTYNYSQYGTASTTSTPYQGSYQYGSGQYQSQNYQSHAGNSQYGAASSYHQYGNTTGYDTSSSSSNWDSSTPLSITGNNSNTNSGNYSNYNSAGQQKSGYNSQSSYQKNSGYSNSGYQSGKGAGSKGYQNRNNYNSNEKAVRVTKLKPFKTDHLYNCPNTGQSIHCTTCDVIMPSYNVAKIHFNSPKHHRKRMNELHYPSDKRQKLLEESETDPDSLKMECTVCGVSPGAYDGFLSHMASLKHLKKLNNIGPETRTFNITCEPCDEQIVTIEHLTMHVNMKSHLRDVTKMLKEKFPHITDTASQWHCAACNKSCNSMQTFDTHCASVKHKAKVKLFENQKFQQQEEVEEQQVEAQVLGEWEPAERTSAVQPERPMKSLKIEKAVPLPEMYQCKVCNFSTSEKYLIDRHYETDSHRANKLLKRRHDELYRVADVAKRDHKGANLGDIVPLNATGAVRCDICELSFAHYLLLDIHKRGRLHKEMEARIETVHDKVVTERKEPAPAGLIASTNKPTTTTIAKTVPKGGHHCDACNVHTSCLTRYLAHVSSKEHRKMMAQLAKSGVPKAPSGDVGEKCEIRASALAPPAPKRNTSYLQPGPGNWPGSNQNNNNKKKKKNNSGRALRVKDYLNGLPPDGIPPEAIREDGRFECKLCSVVVQQEHAYIQHCKGKKHVSKTNIGAETSAGATGPKNTTEVFHCAMCNVTCATGKETLEHLSSKEHAMGPGLKKVEENKKKKEEQQEETDKKEDDGKMETELDPSEIINKFYCDVCDLDCRTEGSYTLHIKGIKHIKKVTALTDEAEIALSKTDCGKSGVRQNLSCAKCQVYCKSVVNYEEHCASDQHKANMALVRFPILHEHGDKYRDWKFTAARDMGARGARGGMSNKREGMSNNRGGFWR